MFERSRLPDSLRWRAAGWMEMGFSQADAARHLNVSRSVVHRLWNQYQTETSVSRRYVPGRTRATAPTGDRFITFSAQRRRISAPQLVADPSVASGRRMSASTVRRRLHNFGLYVRRLVLSAPLNAVIRNPRSTDRYRSVDQMVPGRLKNIKLLPFYLKGCISLGFE
ncbi:transposable element Tcb2 transposase [Trichonephila clavipes]|nr:transposable element Tcb2 transposase [Trichonephila clavipes]